MVFLILTGQIYKNLNAANIHLEDQAANADVHLVLDSNDQLGFRGEFALEAVADDTVILYFNGIVQRSAELKLINGVDGKFYILIKQHGAWEGRLLKIAEPEGYSQCKARREQMFRFSREPTKTSSSGGGPKRRRKDDTADLIGDNCPPKRQREAPTVASSLEDSLQKHQKQAGNDDISNEWWRGLGEGWIKLDAKTLQAKIQCCKSAPPKEAVPIKKPTTPAKRGPGRPRRADKPQVAYCPHCLWLKNRQSFSGRTGRQGNARHGCEWCKIWTKEANDMGYVLTPADKKIIRDEDGKFVCEVLVREIAAANFADSEAAEEAKKAKKDETEEVAEVEEHIEECLVRDSDRTSEGTTEASAEVDSEEE